ncbi:MAG TPA: hypothetical protein DIT64_16225, partial [Verrucomicrobiales bacterium]|nr:hypothetical protein [Verrucomicrobiales bacterium]
MTTSPAPIYHPHFLTAAESLLQRQRPPDLAAAHAALAGFASQHGQPPLPGGLVADLWHALPTGNDRPALRSVSPPLVLVDVTAQGRLARLQMEWIEGAGCTGSLYPHRLMAGCMDAEGKTGGIHTDAAWDGALTAALGHARGHDCGIPGNADIRWRVELVHEKDAFARQSIAGAETEPWLPGASLHGRSAGAAFLIGLVYLARRARAGEAIGAQAREDLVSLLPLLVLPELPGTALDGLGAAVRPKLEALQRHLANLTLIFPESHGAPDIQGAFLAADVAALIGHVTTRLQSEAVPDTIPASLQVSHYVGGADEIAALARDLGQPGVVTVHGPAGVGKTARVLRAVRDAGAAGAFPHGRLFINLYAAARAGGSLPQAVQKDIIAGLGHTPSDNIPEREAQARALLASRRVLVILEGAENVPESDAPSMLALFSGNTHLAWLTRRDSDARLDGFDSRRAHEVRPLDAPHSRELLCHHAGIGEAALDAAGLTALDAIALDAGFTPQLLVWAGRAIGHDTLATPALLAQEIHAAPLAELANPEKRREENARRFFERALARVLPTQDFPALPGTARRLFALLAAFHPAHGAGPEMWALAAGLD